jgi:AAA15 family ATPase/GTPase
VLDMQAANIRGERAQKLSNNIVKKQKHNILKTAVIYGANASGKSNVIKAIRQCCGYVFSSHNFNENTFFDYEVFKFQKESQPSEFQMCFMIDEVEFDYSFSLSKTQIISEKLYYYPKGRKAKIFERNELKSGKKNDIYNFASVIKRPMDVAINTSKKNLFISRASQMDREIPKQIFHFFHSTFILGYQGYNASSVEQLFHNNKKFLLEGLRIADSDIVDIIIHKELVPNTRFTFDPLEDIQKPKVDFGIEEHLKISTFHKSNPSISFDFNTEESQGTKKLFFILLSIIDIIQNNKILLIDEIEDSLHSKIVEFIIQLLHKSKQSQLIFTTHNTNLLDLDLLRKDQINFVHKNESGSTELYSLIDFKDFRDNMNPEKGYLQGRFDAVPIIDLEESLIDKISNNGKKKE